MFLILHAHYYTLLYSIIHINWHRKRFMNKHEDTGILVYLCNIDDNKNMFTNLYSMSEATGRENCLR